MNISSERDKNYLLCGLGTPVVCVSCFFYGCTIGRALKRALLALLGFKLHIGRMKTTPPLTLAQYLQLHPQFVHLCDEHRPFVSQ